MTGSVQSKLLRGTSIILGGKILALGIGLLSKILIARYLGKSGFGSIAIGIAILSILSMVTLLGMNLGVARFLPRYNDQGEKIGILHSAVHIVVPLSIFVSIGVILIAEPLSITLFGNRDLTRIIQIFGAIIPFAVFLKLSIGIFRGFERSLPKVYINDIIFNITQFFGIATVLFLGLKAVGAAGAYLFAYIVSASFAVYIVLKIVPKGTPTNYFHRDLLSFSLPLLATSLMATIYSDIDTFFIGYYFTEGLVGVYNVTYTIAIQINIFRSSLGFLTLPTVSELDANKNVEQIKEIYRRSAKFLILISTPVFYGLLMLPSEIISLLFGSEYASGALALSILSVGFFLHSITGTNTNILVSMGNSRIVLYDRVLSALINIVLNLLLIPTFSLLGAAIATVISYSFLNASFTYRLNKHLQTYPFSKLDFIFLTSTMTIFFLSNIVIKTIFRLDGFIFIGTYLIFGPAYMIIALTIYMNQKDLELILNSTENRYVHDIINFIYEFIPSAGN